MPAATKKVINNFTNFTPGDNRVICHAGAALYGLELRRSEEAVRGPRPRPLLLHGLLDALRRHRLRLRVRQRRRPHHPRRRRLPPRGETVARPAAPTPRFAPGGADRAAAVWATKRPPGSSLSPFRHQPSAPAAPHAPSPRPPTAQANVRSLAHRHHTGWRPPSFAGITSVSRRPPPSFAGPDRRISYPAKLRTETGPIPV